MSTPYQAQTDQQNKFKLESVLVSAEWLCPAAVAGNNAPIKVKTALVADGSSVEIKGKSSSGKAPGTIKGTIVNNCFLGGLPIPDKVEPGAEIWFEAKLPKHGLKIESAIVPAKPKIIVRSMGWDCKAARNGDTVKMSIEFESGVIDGTDATVQILEYDRDGNHDPVIQFPAIIENQKIEIQWEYQYMDDTDEIPTDEEMKKYGKSYNPPEYFFIVSIDGVAIGEKQESGLLEFKDWIELQMTCTDGSALANKEYTIILPDGSKRSGKTDNKGIVSEKDIPPGPFNISFS